MIVKKFRLDELRAVPVYRPIKVGLLSELKFHDHQGRREKVIKLLMPKIIIAVGHYIYAFQFIRVGWGHRSICLTRFHFWLAFKPINEYTERLRDRTKQFSCIKRTNWQFSLVYFSLFLSLYSLYMAHLIVSVYFEHYSSHAFPIDLAFENIC